MSGRPTLGRPLKTTRPSECESKLLSKGAGSGPPEVSGNYTSCGTAGILEM